MLSSSTEIVNSTYINSSAEGTSKYGGLISRSPTKRVREHISSYFEYVRSTTADLDLANKVVEVYRVFTLVMPVFCAGFGYLWQDGSQEGQLVRFIASLAFFFPVDPLTSACSRFLIISAALYFLFFVLIVALGYVFSKYAKASVIFSYIVEAFVTVIGYIFLAPVLYCGGAVLSSSIFDSAFSLQFLIEALVGIALCLAYITFLNTFVLNILAFKRRSLGTYLPINSMIYNMLTTIIWLVAGFSLRAPRTYATVCCVLIALCYIGLLSSSFLYGGMVSTNTSIVASALEGACIITSFVSAGFIAMESRYGFEELLAIVCLMAILYVPINMAFQWNDTRVMANLDQYLDNPDCFDSAFSSGGILLSIIIGTRFAHPCILDWSLIRAAIDKWPKRKDLWIIFMRLAAIYPEETQTLSWICLTLSKLKVSSSVIKVMKRSVYEVIQSRESTLSVVVKKKLNHINKHITASKHKLRRVWELILQSNVNELNGASKKLYREIEENEADLKHLVRLFPNNRFVYRTFATFHRDLTANHAEAKQWMEKTVQLQRGLTVVSDQTHEVGIRTFPLLPKFIKPAIPATFDTTTCMSEADIEAETQGSSSEKGGSSELNMIVHERVKNIKIPIITRAYIVVILMFVLFAILPIVIFQTYASSEIDTVEGVTDFTHALVSVRAGMQMSASFVFRYVLEQLGYITPIDYGAAPLTYLDGKTAVKEQCYALMASISSGLSDMLTLKTYQVSDSIMNSVRNDVFGTTLEYKHFTTATTYTTKKFTLADAIADQIVEYTEILDGLTITSGIFADKYLVSVRNNAKAIVDRITDSLDTINQYVIAYNSETHTVVIVVMVLLCILLAVVIIGSHMLIKRGFDKTKSAIYSCFTGIPKKVITELAENLTLFKHDGGTSASTERNEEMSRQEENALKLFVLNAGETQRGDKKKIKDYTALFGLIVCIWTAIVYIGVIFLHQNDDIDEFVPQINYYYSSFGDMIAAYITVFTVGVNDTYTSTVGFTAAEEASSLQHLIANAKSAMNTAQFGSQDRSIPELTTIRNRAAGLASSCSVASGVAYSNYGQLYDCTSTEYLKSNQFASMEKCVKIFENPTATIDLNDPNLAEEWRTAFTIQLETMYGPIFDQIPNVIRTNLAADTAGEVYVIVAICICAAFFEILMLSIVQEENVTTRFTVSLLEHCPPEIVTGSPSIMKMLTGDFSNAAADGESFDKEFFDSALYLLPEAHILCTTDLSIEHVNKAFESLFNPDDYIGKHITTLFETEGFNCDADKLAALTEPKQVTYTSPDGTKYDFVVDKSTVSQKIVFSMRDVTRSNSKRKMIKEEKQKVDSLLSSILPANLASRVQNGEKNISFAVQTASIVFIDIVSFTPWCSSAEAATVMKILNALFKAYDELIAKSHTLTKIKCIGDCYMCAGGIFNEINQPSLHAKEAVSFGLNAIKAVTKLNKDFNTSLQVRVGINTGGPIVAGVLGVGKPTFEILGPAINMAQQMEHHGVAMKVHISRSVYELIYGENFSIKERGSVEIKGGSVLTYLVE